jgi:uncharacterized membrane protein HdeD (DUF308 family)
MSEETLPNWVRIADVVVGALAVIAALIVFTNLVLAQLAAIFLLSFSFLSVGLSRIARAAAVPWKGTPRRIVNLVTGITAIFLMSIVFFYSALEIETMIILVGWTMIVIGAARVLIGILENDVKDWMRIIQIIVGLSTIALAFTVIAMPTLEFLVISLLLSIGALANGLTRIGRGYAGI